MFWQTFLSGYIYIGMYTNKTELAATAQYNDNIKETAAESPSAAYLPRSVIFLDLQKI